MLGNTTLIEHGITTDPEEVTRIHVAVGTGLIFVFSNAAAKQAVEQGKGRPVGASQHDIETSRGRAIPITEIDGLKQYDIPLDLWELAKHTPIDYNDTSKKGRLALNIVIEMLKRGLIPLTVSVKEITDKAIQIKGLDITVKADIDIQVKYDRSAGPCDRKGTGNLYIETHECNPFRKY